MSSDFDEGSFPKVRSWLLVFSSTIMALWFFGADLKNVSVLGTQIEFTRNTEHVWLVALAINAYLLLRFYQHQPDIAASDSGLYMKCYQGLMLKCSVFLNKSVIKRSVLTQAKAYMGDALEDNKTKCVIASVVLGQHHNAKEKRRYLNGMVQFAEVDAYCLISHKDASEPKKTRNHVTLLHFPYWQVCVCAWLSIVNVWIKTSHATEYLVPYIWSGCAAAVCLLRWHAAAVAQ